MNTIITAVIVLCSCGFLAGVALAIASRVFAVKTDPRVEQIEKILPGANCSGCGNPSCYAYAKSMVEDNAAPNLCVLAQDKAEEIGRILGKEVTAAEPKIAVIRCSDGALGPKQFEYSGIPSCRAAGFFCGGDNACQYSCLGFGDCIRVCPFGALSHQDRKTPEIDPEVCTGCGNCVAECPKQAIILVPKKALPHIACNTKDKGKIVRQNCQVGCISCGKCIKTCPEEAIVMQDDLISFDYSKCNACGKCIEACPRKIIVQLGDTKTGEAVNQ